MAHSRDTCSRYHGMYRRQMGLAFRTAIDALAGEVATILHAHGWSQASREWAGFFIMLWMCGGKSRNSRLWLVQSVYTLKHYNRVAPVRQWPGSRIPALECQGVDTISPTADTLETSQTMAQGQFSLCRWAPCRLTMSLFQKNKTRLRSCCRVHSTASAPPPLAL